MTKLTDTQLVLLSKASQRDDHAIELPPNLRGGAVKAVVTKLINCGLVVEVAAKPEMPSWRRDESGSAFALVITTNGFEALGIEPNLASKSDTTAKSAGEPRRDDAPDPENEARALSPREGTKQAKVTALLRREQGATLNELVAATNWLPHTTRAALTGLRKKGHDIVKSKGEDQRTVYRIAPGEGVGTPAKPAKAA